MNNIYLIGFMGAGKSAVSRALREKTGRRLYDTDMMVEQKKEMTVSEIFEKCGENEFRAAEKEVVASLTKKRDCIVSCGGGVVLSGENIRELKRGGKVVLLSATPETILERVSRNDKRPLLRGKKNIADISEMMDRRLPAYREACDFCVVTDEKTTEEIAEEILNRISE